MTPSTPAHARAHARLLTPTDVPRCGAVLSAYGDRCEQRVRIHGMHCWHHRFEARALPVELVVLRDPRTGEPMEVT